MLGQPLLRNSVIHNDKAMAQNNNTMVHSDVTIRLTKVFRAAVICLQALEQQCQANLSQQDAAPLHPPSTPTKTQAELSQNAKGSDLSPALDTSSDSEVHMFTILCCMGFLCKMLCPVR